jgi:phosphomethylpyrimidine synthase
MRISHDIRDSTRQQEQDEQDAIRNGMLIKSKEFTEGGSVIYK